jgi:hypothetical protein
MHLFFNIFTMAGTRTLHLWQVEWDVMITMLAVKAEDGRRECVFHTQIVLLLAKRARKKYP